MKPFRLLWVIHKWLGIVLGALLLLVAGTGFLLLIKKESAWIMPPTQTGAPGPATAIRPIHEVYAAALAIDRRQLRSEADIDRIDFRPADRVFKIHSRHDNFEVQVDATTLAILSEGRRRSDWIESLHDGSLLGAPVHDYAMPLTALGLILLTITGYLLWIWPYFVRRQALRRQAERAATRRTV